MREKRQQLVISRYLNFFITTGIISLTLTLVNFKGGNFPFVNWFRSWLVAFFVISILASFLPKVVSDIVAKLLRDNKGSEQ